MSTSPPLAGIEHIVVLMLENRSFDNILGRLYPDKDSSEYDGLPLDSTNPTSPTDPTPIRVWNDTSGEASRLSIPYPDPGESYSDMTTQIFGSTDDSGAADMSGFAYNYSQQAPMGDPPVSPTARDIMQYFTPEDLPISNGLAAAYAVSDSWYASGPVQTFPNRQFLLAGTPGSVLDVPLTEDLEYAPFLGSRDDKTVLELLDDAYPGEDNWKIYYHDYPIAMLSKYVDDRSSTNLFNFDTSDWGDASATPTFLDDVAQGTLPKFSLIEPRYTADVAPGGQPPNCNHPGNSYAVGQGPPINCLYGEVLLLQIWLALAENPDLFDKTLLIITYDEHGGCYDHVPPGPATSPFTLPLGFPYDRYGVRVPTIFVNPRIPPGTINRPPASGNPYDHTSVIATLCAQFGLSGPLTPRDESAPVIEIAFDDSQAPNIPDPSQFALPEPTADLLEPGPSRAGPGVAMKGLIDAFVAARGKG